ESLVDTLLDYQNGVVLQAGGQTGDIRVDPGLNVLRLAHDRGRGVEIGCWRKDECVGLSVEECPRAIIRKPVEPVSSKNVLEGHVEGLARIVRQIRKARRVGGPIQVGHGKQHDGLVGIDADAGETLSAARVTKCKFSILAEIVGPIAYNQLAQRRSNVAAE